MTNGASASRPPTYLLEHGSGALVGFARLLLREAKELVEKK